MSQLDARDLTSQVMKLRLHPAMCSHLEENEAIRCVCPSVVLSLVQLQLQITAAQNLSTFRLFHFPRDK